MSRRSPDENIHVVLGGSGSVGRPLIDELLARGHRVRAVTRTEFDDPPEGVETMLADVALADGATVACEGASVVYNCVFPPANAAVITACASAGAKLVLADSLAMYDCNSGPMAETTRFDLGNRESGRTRAEMEHRLMDAHRTGDLRATIGRASDVYGPGVIVSVVGSSVMRAALDGRASTVLGNPDLLHTYTYNRDFARALAVLGESDRADGAAWHVPSAQTVTTREFLSLAYGEAGKKTKLRRLGPVSLRLLGLLSKQVRRARREKLYQFQSPFVSDHSKYEAAFGAETTPHPQAIIETLEWFRNY
jgi:nucleoside-diphosphate-sugar epimerase